MARFFTAVKKSLVWLMRLGLRILKRLLWPTVLLGIVCALLALWYTTPYYARTVLHFLDTRPVHINTTAAQSQTNHLAPRIEANPIWLEAFKTAMGRSHTEDSVDPAQVDESLIAPYDPSVAIKPPEDVFWQEVPNHIGASIASNTDAKVIVVLGGGLTRNQQNDIILNSFSTYRLHRAMKLAEQTHLPILLSGVEAPYMKAWLKAHGGAALYNENKSLNTCENARFTALLLLKYGGARKIHVVTDAYHMPRARRLFADNGITIVPHMAPLPSYVSSTWPNPNVLVHSRRATYELAAYLRDRYLGGSSCREVP